MKMYSGILAVLFAGLALGGLKKEESMHSSFMSIYETQCLKGIFAFEVVLCHIYAYYQEGIAMKLFNKIGYLSIAMFFIFAGYGLIINAKAKKNYMKDFLPRRLGKLYIPLWISLILSDIIRKILGATRVYSFNVIAKDIIGINAIWFFIVIVCYYFAFYVIWKLTKGKNAIQIMAAFTILQCVICAALNMGKEYYTSSFGFILGMILAEEKMINYSRIKKYFAKIKNSIPMKMGILFTILLCGILYIKMHESVFVGQLIFRNLLGIVIVSLFLVFLYHYKMGNRVTDLLGKCSYEIYLLHPAIIVSVKIGYTSVLPSTLQVILIIVITLTASIILQRITSRIIKKRKS